MTPRPLIFIAAALAPCLAAAQDAPGNPARMATLQDSSHSEMHVGLTTLAHMSEMAQDGAKWRGWEAAGRTFLRLGESSVAWGHASYTDGRRTDVMLSETADYAEIGPMAVADTAGGDKEREAYDFLAGFAWRGRKAGAGLQVDYSSATEFRTADPRPKADATVARVTAGGWLAVADGHTLGLFGALRKYSQEIDIDFYNEYGAAATIYHLQGLGTDYTRFAGSNDEAYYKGKAIGGGLTYDGRVSAEVGIGRNHLEKEMPDLGNAVIDETTRQCLWAKASCPMASERWSHRIAISAIWMRNELTQNIFDDGTRTYRPIARRKPYEATAQEATAEFHSAKGEAARVELTARAKWSHTAEKNTDARRTLEKTTLEACLHATAWNQATRRLRLSYGLGATHRAALATLCDLGAPAPKEMPRALAIERAAFERQTTARTGGEANVRADVGGWRHFRTIFLRAAATALWYEGRAFAPAWGVTLTAGVTI